MNRALRLAALPPLLLLVLAGCTGGGGSSGGGDPVAIRVSGLGSAFNYTQGSYLVGFRFTVPSALTVTDLGYWDSNLEGSVGETFDPTAVGLYDLTTDALVASATVVASDPALGFYRYHALAEAVTLGTADTYALVAVSGGNYYVSGVGGCAGGYACSGATASDRITLHGGACLGGDDACLTTTDTLVEPTATSTWINLGPNLRYTE
jgi:hypothetical protein